MADAKGSTPLFAKLARILGEIGRVAKNGRNDHHGYDYVTEADLVEAVRGKLSEAGIAYFFSVVEVSTRDVETVIQNKKTESWDRIPAKAGAITTVLVEATFADSDSGETFSVQGAGQGQDAGDKGVYKALTGAQKYILMKTFLIATGDDPEGDTTVDKAHAEEAKTSKKAEAPREPEKKKKPAKTEARDHAPAVNAQGEEEEDWATKVLPGGPWKGKAVGTLNLEQTTQLLATMPKGNTWTTLVQRRHEYLTQFEKMPEPLKEVANELDLEIDKKLAAQEG